MLTEEEVMLRNEVLKVDRLIAGRKNKLSRLIKNKTVKDPIFWRPKRYAVEYTFDPARAEITGFEPELSPQTQSFIVEEGSIFRPSQMESVLVLTSREGEGSNALAQLTIPWGDRLSRNVQFDYFWSIYDSGSDREWQNNLQPSCFMLSGLLGPLWLQNRAVLGPGTEVFITIEPFKNNSAAFSGGLIEVNSYSLYIAMSGFEQKVDL